MAVREIEKSSAKAMEYIGESADVKPTNVPVGSIFFESDTKKFFIWNGSAWIAFA